MVKSKEWVSTNEKKGSVHISVRAKLIETSMSTVLMTFHNIKKLQKFYGNTFVYFMEI